MGDFLVAANALGPAFAYHFLGAAITSAGNGSSWNGTGSSTGGAEGSPPLYPPSSSSSSSGEAYGYNDSQGSSSSTGGLMAAEGSSTGEGGESEGGLQSLAELLLDYDKSTLAWPPKPSVTCGLLEHEVGYAFIRSFLCQAVKGIDSPYATVLSHQCRVSPFNCTSFLHDVFTWNLTNSVFAIRTTTYSTDALMIALHYHSEAAVLAPSCTHFRLLTSDQLTNALGSAVTSHVNVGVLMGLVVGGSALMVVSVLLLVLSVSGGLQWRAAKAKARETATSRREEGGEEERG